MSINIEQALHNARSLTEAGQHDDARLCLLEALKDDPNNATALIMLGGAYFSMQRYSEAEMVFERLIIMEPGRGDFSIALFNTLWKMDRKEEALEEIKRFMLHADKNAESSTIEQYMKIIESYFS